MQELNLFHQNDILILFMVVSLQSKTFNVFGYAALFDSLAQQIYGLFMVFDRFIETTVFQVVFGTATMEMSLKMKENKGKV